MFLLLVRARLQMLGNAARSASGLHKAVTAVLFLLAAVLFVGIAAVCGALVLIAQQGGPVGDGLTAATRALIARTEEYLFFFLLAGSIPFVAATLFQADDLPLLLTTPVPARVIVGAKLLDAAAVNAAQFLFLGVPVLVGLGWATDQSLIGWLWLLVTTLLLLVLPPAVTALLLLIAAKALGLQNVRLGVMLVSIFLGLTVTTLAVLGASRAVHDGDLDLPRLEAALHGEHVAGPSLTAAETAPSWLPSTWAAGLLEETAGGHPLRGAGLRDASALIGTTALLVWLCLQIGQDVLASEGMLEQTGRIEGRHGHSYARLLGIPPAISGLLLKDKNYLLRDLILLGQIGTALILFLVPLLLKVAQGTEGAMDNDLYGGLALAMLGLIVYMVTSIVSLSSVGLEGRGFWLVLSSPVSRAAFLRAKWLGAFGLSAGIVLGLTAIAWKLFALNGAVTLGALGVFLFACGALSGVGVGLAGLFPRFVYENPAHRASVTALVLGFVLATGYLVVCGLEVAGLYIAVTKDMLSLHIAAIIGVSSFVVLSVLTGLIPVQMAEQRLRNYDWEF